MKAIFLLLLSCGVLLASSDLSPVHYDKPPHHDPIQLIRNGKLTATIVTPESMPENLRIAVRELTECLSAMTGDTPKVIKAGATVTGNAILIGRQPETLAAGLDGTTMPKDGFRILTAPQRIYLVGNDTKPSRGSEWAIYDFCERTLGVRWYFPEDQGGRSIPKPANLTVKPMAYQDAPVFEMRTIFPSGGKLPGQKYQLFKEFFRVQRANNVHDVQLIVHAPYPFLYVKEGYDKSTPEIFQMRSDGQRDFSMLCYGNPKTLEVYMDRLDEEMKGGRKSHFVNKKAITVSPWDAEIACHCPYCRKLFDPQAGSDGTASRIMTNFVQKLALRVKDKYPDMTVIFLPYLNYVQCPPKTQFPGNVEIQLCSMPGLALFKEPQVRDKELATMKAWQRATGRKIQNWHYLCWPEDRTSAQYLFPNTILDFYQNHGDTIVGSFINGTTDHSRQNISIYFWLKALWNPNLNIDRVLTEYCQRMYGPAKETMRQLIDMQIDGWEKNLWHSPGMSAKRIFTVSYPRKDVQKMEKLLNLALAQAKDDPLIMKRLRYYARPFPYFFKESKDYASGKALRKLMMQKASGNPVIDGVLNEPDWNKAQENYFVRATDRQRTKPFYPTTVKALWTPDGITFGFRLSEPTPQKLETRFTGKDASNLWGNDNVEIFFDVTGKGEGDYYQFIVDSVQGVLDSDTGNAGWTCPGVKSAVFKGKDFWTLEVFIPFAPFRSKAKAQIPTASGTGLKWMGNFTRHRVADSATPQGKAAGSVNEYTRMNTTYARGSANLSDFADFLFVE